MMPEVPIGDGPIDGISVVIDNGNPLPPTDGPIDGIAVFKPDPLPVDPVNPVQHK